MKAYRSGSIALILLGLLHLFSYLLLANKPSDAVLAALLNDMNNYKIQFFGSHSLLKFHKGFSIMMGVLISAFGVQNLIASKGLTKSYLVPSMVITGIALILSVSYFHLLPISFLSFSLLCYCLSFKHLKQG